MKNRFFNLFEKLRWRYTGKSAYYLFVFVLLSVMVFGTVAVYFFERGVNPQISTYGDSLWLILVTVTTVGYGDLYPITVGGRVAVTLLMFTGIILLSAFISTRSAVMVEKARRRAKGLEKSTRFRGHFVVCGWNERANYALENLKKQLEPQHIPVVLVCDQEENPVDDDYIYFIKGSPVSEKDLQRANIGEAHAVILLADEAAGGKKGDTDARTVLSALTIKSLNPRIQITAESLETENVYHLENAGVDEILDSNAVLGNLLAISAVRFGLIGIVSEMVSTEYSSRISTVDVDEEMARLKIDDLMEKLSKEKGLRILAVESGGTIRKRDRLEEVFPGDKLIVISERQD